MRNPVRGEVDRPPESTVRVWSLPFDPVHKGTIRARPAVFGNRATVQNQRNPCLSRGFVWSG